MDSSGALVGQATVEFANDEALLAEVLRVYKPDCRYLKSAVVTGTESGLAAGRCEFAIPAPFYIDDTGHFNAVEFILCYNQMVYYVVAKCVKEGLMPPFGQWTLEQFRQRQLANFLIVNFRSSFLQRVAAQRFSGELVFTDLTHIAWRRIIATNTTCRYWDDADGNCSGEVRLAITNAPAVAPA